MMGRLSKWFQRRVLDAVLHDPPPIVAIIFFALASVFILGYWSAQNKSGVVLPGYGLHGVFGDNIAGKSYFDELGTGILPVDVVYTWVNGSDPILVSGLRSLLRKISGQCSPPQYCAQARYVAVPLRSSVNISHLTSIIQETPRLAGALPYTAQTGVEGSSSKQFVVARVMSPSVQQEDDMNDALEMEREVNVRRPSLPRLTGSRGGGGRSPPAVGTTPPVMSDVDEVVSDLQRRLSEAGIEVVASQTLWSTESNHGWSVPKDTAAFVISDTEQDVDVMYHKVTRSIPQFDQSCDRQVVPNGFFVECIDKLLIDDLREAVILYNTPQTDDLLQAKDARVHASLHNNVPVLAGRKRGPSGGGVKEKKREDRGPDPRKGSGKEEVDGQLQGDAGKIMQVLNDRGKGRPGNLRKSFRGGDGIDVVRRDDVRLDSAPRDFLHNDSKRSILQRQLQSVKDDFINEMPQVEAKTFYDNFVGDFNEKNLNEEKDSVPESLNVKKQLQDDFNTRHQDNEIDDALIPTNGKSEGSKRQKK